jgi:hypothetical protein
MLHADRAGGSPGAAKSAGLQPETPASVLYKQK